MISTDSWNRLWIAGVSLKMSIRSFRLLIVMHNIDLPNEVIEKVFWLPNNLNQSRLLIKVTRMCRKTFTRKVHSILNKRKLGKNGIWPARHLPIMKSQLAHVSQFQRISNFWIEVMSIQQESSPRAPRRNSKCMMQALFI